MDPICRKGFQYENNVFYALPSPNTRHRRASIDELRTFFRAKASILDQPVNWFKAQLLHYGLPPTDHKSTAAMPLLDALNRDELEVPFHVDVLQLEMKREWERQVKEKEKAKKKSTGTKGVKRKIDDEGVAVSCAGLNLNINLRLGQGDQKKVMVKEEEVAPHGYYSSSLRPGRHGYRMQQPPSNLPSSRVTLGLLNGNYKIDSQAFDTRNSGMILCLDGSSIWGEFQLGPIEGILFMPNRPYQIMYAGEGSCFFEWRARDTEMDHVSCGSGEIRFLGNGSVEGSFCGLLPFGYEDCEFWGLRTSGKNETRAARDAWSMRAEYQDLGDEF
ncbi:hypothetical protein AWENTII_012414 [Aspergillus wentii]